VSPWLLVGLAVAQPTGWEVLQSEQVAIRCRDVPAGRFTCEAVTRIAAAPDAVWDIVSNPAGYPQVFPRVDAAVVRDDGAIDVQFTLPWPLPAWPLRVEPSADPTSRRITLRDVGPGPGVWDHAEVSVRARDEGTELQWTWHGRQRHAAWIHRRVQRTYGHDSLWAVAQAVGSDALTPP